MPPELSSSAVVVAGVAGVGASLAMQGHRYRRHTKAAIRELRRLTASSTDDGLTVTLERCDAWRSRGSGQRGGGSTREDRDVMSQRGSCTGRGPPVVALSSGMTEHDEPDTGHLVTDLLAQLSAGEAGAFDRLVPLVYAELRQVAARQLQVERPDHTLDPTSLVHEVYFRLVRQRKPQYADRAHFFGVAARAMRRILVDHARGRRRLKRDAAMTVDLTPSIAAQMPDSELLAVDELLEQLAAIDARQARIVELRYFIGLSLEETASVLDISPATVKRDWVLARAWLKDAIDADR